MPDISMCSDTKCLLNINCYRYTAIPSYSQLYADFVYNNGCDYYWNNEGYEIEKKENKVYKKARMYSSTVVKNILKECKENGTYEEEEKLMENENNNNK